MEAEKEKLREAIKALGFKEANRALRSVPETEVQYTNRFNLLTIDQTYETPVGLTYIANMTT